MKKIICEYENIITIYFYIIFLYYIFKFLKNDLCKNIIFH